MRNILGFPKIWWPKLRNSERKISLASLRTIMGFVWTVTLVKLKVNGARVIHYENQKSALRLNKKTALGEKNEIIHIEPDDVIYRALSIFGEWGKAESEFLATICEEKITFIDLGANVGLITKQLLNLTNQIDKVLVVEPRTETMANLRLNLMNTIQISQIEAIFCQFALDKISGISILYTEVGNIGNSSLEKNLTPNSFRETVRIMSSESFYTEFLNNEESYILKSDLQGLDATVLNALPQQFWKRVKGAVIEVWPSESIDYQEVFELSKKLTNGFKCSFSPTLTKCLDSNMLTEYWSSPDNKSQNLYLRKNQ